MKVTAVRRNARRSFLERSIRKLPLLAAGVIYSPNIAVVCIENCAALSESKGTSGGQVFRIVKIAPWRQIQTKTIGYVCRNHFVSRFIQTNTSVVGWADLLVQRKSGRLRNQDPSSRPPDRLVQIRSRCRRKTRGQRYRHHQQTRQRPHHRAGAGDRRSGWSMGPNGLESGCLLRKSAEGI